MMDTKIKQDQICIGKNIREIRISKGMGQTELVRKIQLRGITMTRETLVKIERGVLYRNLLDGVLPENQVKSKGAEVVRSS